MDVMQGIAVYLSFFILLNATFVNSRVFVQSNLESEKETFISADATTATKPPPCISSSDEFGYVNGSLSSTQTFLKCLNNIPDAAVYPTYYNNKMNGAVNFSVGLTLSNLIKIDEIEGTATLSFSIGLSWYDQRFSMPSFWSAISPTKSIDLTNILQNQNIAGFFFYPIIRYPDSSEVEILSTDFSLTSKNMFIVKQSVMVTLVESGFKFYDYPGDTQCIQLRLYIYPYDSSTARMTVYGNGISFSTDSSGGNTFASNQIWSYKSATASTYTSQGASSGTSIWFGQIYMERKGSGIVIRLVLPLFLLLLLSAVTFWMTTEKRVDVTITIMLSVSALYIVILGNIPLVGYLTKLDKFVFWMFLLLIVVVTLHQVYSTVEEKKDNFPLRILYMRLIEAIGRIFLMPCIVIYFSNSIPMADGAKTSTAIVYTAIALAIVVGGREMIGIRDKYLKSLSALINKVNHEETTLKDITPIELLVINYWKFNKISTSPEYLSELFSNGKRLHTNFQESQSLKNVAKLKNLMEGSNTNNNDRDGNNRRTGLSPLEIQMINLRNSSINHEDVNNPMRFEAQFVENGSNLPSLESGRMSVMSKNNAEVDSDDEEDETV